MAQNDADVDVGCSARGDGVEQISERSVLGPVGRMNVLQLDIKAILRARDQLQHFFGVDSGAAIRRRVRRQQWLDGHLLCNRERRKETPRRTSHGGGIGLGQIEGLFSKRLQIDRRLGTALSWECGLPIVE